MSPYIGPFVNSHKHTLWVTSCTAPAILVLLGKVVSDIYMATNEITITAFFAGLAHIKWSKYTFA